MITALKFACTATSNLPVASSTFDSFLRALETDTPQKRKCRKLKADGSKDYNDYKRKNVPAWTIGVRFSGARSNANAQAEGYVTVDFDDVPDCESLKGQLAQCPHVLLAARSAGGNGVFCIVVTTPEIQLDPERIKLLWAELSRFTRMPVGAKDIDGAHIDGSCSDAARLRIESYDPCYAYNPDARIWKPFEELCHECYMGSQLHELSLCFGGRRDGIPHNCHARNAFALAALSMVARARVYGENPFGHAYYAFKSQTVVLGRTGANKTTTLGALRAAVGAFAVREILTASDAMLIDTVARCSATSEGKGQDMTWTERPDPQPIIEVIDEAGDDKAARKGREYSSQSNGIRRSLFDERTNLSAALSRPAPPFPVRSSYTNIQLSTPERWADGLVAGDAAAGDARRIAEFWMPSPLDGQTACDAYEIARAMREAQQSCEPPDAAKLIEMLSQIDRPERQIMLPSHVSAWTLDEMGAHLGDSKDIRSIELNNSVYQTLASSFATACAFARKGDSIEEWDFLAGCSLLLGVLDTRRKLAPLACHAVDTQQNAITDMILGTVRTSGPCRLDALKRKFASPDHARTLAALIADGQLVKYRAAVDGGQTRTLIRLATDAEVEKNADAMPDFSEERANRDKVIAANNERLNASAFGTLTHAEYMLASDEGKRKKLDAYLAGHEKESGHELVKGQRDHSLRSLATKLHNASLDDAFAETWFRELCASLGDEFAQTRVQDRLWRKLAEKVH